MRWVQRTPNTTLLPVNHLMLQRLGALRSHLAHVTKGNIRLRVLATMALSQKRLMRRHSSSCCCCCCPHHVLLVTPVPYCYVCKLQRASAMRTHRNEVCFPGGKVDSEVDKSIFHTATREVVEEIGMRAANIEGSARLQAGTHCCVFAKGTATRTRCCMQLAACNNYFGGHLMLSDLHWPFP